MKIKDAAIELGVSYWSVLRWVIDGKAPGKKIGGRWVVSKAWVTKQAKEMRQLQEG